MAYPTLATLIGASDVTALTGADPQVQENLYALAKFAVESYCGQSFELEEDLTIRVDGSGTRELPLPRRLAVLDSLSAVNSSLTGSDMEISPDHTRLYVVPDPQFNWYEKAIRDDQPPYFPAGANAVSITGDWGFTDVEMPDNDPTTRLAIALRLDMEEQALAMTSGLSDSSRAFVKLRVANLNEGPLNYGVDQGAIGLSPNVMMLLEPYVWRGLGVLV